ncbi:hypothetical protein OIDMADRAFT_59335 [Oidiodendron maius Zn]|uniref:Uncharacterized protein n=1 Tax=Oidiodendron maius (strain Zn) TaxID=913774 RepID=A0A0C3C9F1_OIDMZ|nr:hypothetical protein OIDMADRAFT_59335 [Oidiodendron maius Zn]
MQFSIVMLAVFGTLAVANPFSIYPNLAKRDACGAGCGAQPNDACCSVQGCCYPCKEGSDADCAPEVTERSLLETVVV